MKTLLLTLTCCFVLANLYAQKIEFSVQANSGLFHYSGKSAEAVSFINHTPNEKQNYTNNPYGSKNGFSYGGDVQAQFVSRDGFIAGLQAGYDVLRSKTAINSVALDLNYLHPIATMDQAAAMYAANGETFLKDQFINVSPYVGYRLKIKKVKLDLMPGFDMGFNNNSHEKGHATVTVPDGTINTYKTDIKITDVPTDVRLKFGVAATYNRFGLTASFAHGLTNYKGNVTGDGTYEAYSELLRLGITYRIF